MARAIVKQARRDDGSCAACVAAMAVGDETTSDFLRFLTTALRSPGKASPPYKLAEVAAFLASRGYILGVGFALRGAPRRLAPGDELEGRLALGGPGVPDETVAFYISVERSVEQGERSVEQGVEARPGALAHAIYFDGVNVFDPDPEADPLLGLADYVVREVWPILDTSTWREDGY